MTFDNKGRIRPAAGPEGHTHSIYQLNDITASGVDNQTLVSSNGVWVPQTAIPYAMVAGQYVYDSAISLAAGAGLNLTTISYLDFAEENPFTISPVVTVSLSSLPGGSQFLLVRNSANINGFSLYVYNTGTTTATVAANTLRFNIIAVQMQADLVNGATSTDPARF